MKVSKDKEYRTKVTLEAHGYVYTFEGDYSTLDSWAELVKKMMYCSGHHPDNINQIIKEE